MLSPPGFNAQLCPGGTSLDQRSSSNLLERARPQERSRRSSSRDPNLAICHHPTHRESRSTIDIRERNTMNQNSHLPGPTKSSLSSPIVQWSLCSIRCYNRSITGNDDCHVFNIASRNTRKCWSIPHNFAAEVCYFEPISNIEPLPIIDSQIDCLGANSPLRQPFARMVREPAK